MSTNINPISCQNKWNTIYLSFYKDGKKEYIKYDNFKNYFYFSDYDVPILDKKLAVKQFGNKKDSLNFDNTYESDISAAKRFMIDNFGHLQSLDKVDLRIGYFDIECLIEGKITINGNFPISAISIYDSKTQKICTFAFKEGINRTDKENFIKIYDNEERMFNDFLKFMDLCKFDLLVGWNCTKNEMGDGFDIPYLCNRLNKFKLINKLSPFGLVEKHWRNENEFIIYGLTVLDYMNLYGKYSYKTSESNRLDTIANTVLGEGKLEYKGDLNTLYKNDFNTYIKYNRQDVMLLAKMEEKLKYIDTLDELRRLCLNNIDEALSNSVNIDSLLLKTLNTKGFIVRSKRKSIAEEYPGAYVKDPIAGVYEGIICLDFTSLYPWVVINSNISPETLIGEVSENYVPKENEIKTSANVIFKKDIIGIFPSILRWIFKKRKEYQKLSDEAIDKNEKENYNKKQEVFKILLNSFYGFTGFSGSRFFDVRLAKSITLNGQTLIKYAISELEKDGFNVITSDTDSTYISLKNRVMSKEEGIKVGNEIREKINNKLKIFCKEKFNIDDADFDFKVEGFISRGVFFKKKHYVINWTNKKGKDCDKMEAKGVQIKKSDTSKYTKKYLVPIYDMIIKNKPLEEIDNLIKEFRNNIDKVPPEEIGLPCTVQDLKSYKKNLPIHARGAKVWELNFANQYKKSFENIMKGKRYFITNKNLYDDPKDPVLCVPEGFDGLPPTIFIDFERTKESIIEKPLENILNVLDDLRVKESINSYLEKDYDDFVYDLYLTLFKLGEANELRKDLHKKNNVKKLIKYIDASVQNRIFNKYCEIKNIFNKNFSKEIIKNYFKEIDVNSISINIENKKEEKIEVKLVDSYF
jgi:DNA polymerase elongation subunit (family B)